jgi:hypothetical protein
MTVLSLDRGHATMVTVDDDGQTASESRATRLNDDLTVHADLAGATSIALRANEGLSSMGFALYGPGFVLEPEEAGRILSADPRYHTVVRPYRNGKDLTARPRGVYVIDFGYMSLDEARGYALVLDLVRDRVKPARDANARETIRTHWWRFGWPRKELREALVGLTRFIATTETSKHRHFTLLDAAIAPDNMLIGVASSEAWHFGVLSSCLHLEWALNAGGTLEDRPRYNKTQCFDPFPFPDPPLGLRSAIGDKAEQLDAHRKAALARSEKVTMTGMYNVVEKLRSGEPLTKKEREVHELAACGVLRDLHDELDRLVAEAYGWPWPMEKEEILERLVALHDERIAEEQTGKVRWLRPEYQIPRFGKDLPLTSAELSLRDDSPPRSARAGGKRVAAFWPTSAAEQILAVKSTLAESPRSADQVVACFTSPKPELVARHLNTLALLGEAMVLEDGRYALAA